MFAPQNSVLWGPPGIDEGTGLGVIPTATVLMVGKEGTGRKVAGEAAAPKLWHLCPVQESPVFLPILGLTLRVPNPPVSAPCVCHVSGPHRFCLLGSSWAPYPTPGYERVWGGLPLDSCCPALSPLTSVWSQKSFGPAVVLPILPVCYPLQSRQRCPPYSALRFCHFHLPVHPMWATRPPEVIL